MQLTVQELAALVGGQFAFGPEEAAKVIRGVAGLGEAGEGDVTFFGNPKYLPALRACRATAVLVPLGFTETIAPTAIPVENPSLAFAKLVERFAPAPVKFAPGVHPSAVIGEGVVLGEGVSIQPFAVVEPGAKIGARTVIGAHCYVGHDAAVGEDCFLHPRVTVGARCILGNRIIVQSGAILGSDGFGFELSGGRHVKIPQTGIVQVDDDVEIGANTTIDRARFGRTWIQEGTKIDNLVQIAHNVVVGKHCILVSQVGISGSTRLGQYVTLAGQVGVVGHIQIGDHAVVGAQSGVSKSISAKETYMGPRPFPRRSGASRSRTSGGCRSSRIACVVWSSFHTRQANLYPPKPNHLRGHPGKSSLPDNRPCAMATRKRKVSSPKLPMQRQFAFAEQGRYFNLRRIFDKLNALYFGNRLKGYVIQWGRRRRQRPKDYIVFGTIQEDDRVIRIHPLLDQAFVPGWFLDYVVYHEMLHAVVPDEFDASGRRRVHHEKFLARERCFRWFKRAKAWEEENLARFLR